jgi:hypothetical protein
MRSICWALTNKTYMTKYTRSIQKLTTNIEDLFAVGDISRDTLTILMILAATMNSEPFNRWLDKIPALNHINARCKEINQMRFKFGDSARDYIMLTALQAVDYDVSSLELQQYISDNALGLETYDNLDPALTTAAIAQQAEYYANDQSNEFFTLKAHAGKYLLKQLNNAAVPHLHDIVAVFIQCRQLADSIAAYYAIVYAIYDILQQDGVIEQDALAYSNKLVQHALNHFIYQTDHKNAILHVYSKSFS